MLALPHSGKRCKVPGQGKFRSAFRLQKSKACRFTRQLQVISGYVKYDQRAILKQILERKLPGMPEERKRTVHVFVESVRALARNAMVGEEIYKQSKKNNINIPPQDYATLFSHSDTPTGNFIRKLICSLQELDRDTLVWRLQQGRENKAKTATSRTQSGKPKVNGIKSYLEDLQPSKDVQQKIVSLGKKRDRGDFGWRPMANEVSKLLGMKQSLPRETVCTIRFLTRNEHV